MLSLLLGLVAIVFAVRILRLAVKYPRWPVFMVCGLLLCVPVALLDWARAPRFVVVSPLLALLVFAAWKFISSALAQLSELRDTRRGAPLRERRCGNDGWWNAPTMPATDTGPRLSEADSCQSAGESGSDDVVFHEMMRRNFPDGGRLSPP